MKFESSGQEFVQRLRDSISTRQRRTSTDNELTCSAVLILLRHTFGEWHVVVTQRTETVGHHKGQMAFPGGACEPGDANLVATALRETEEEIGVRSRAIEILGALDDYPTITHFVVTPIVGILSEPTAYVLNRDEVANVVEVPLSFLADGTNLRREKREHQGKVYDLLFWDYGPYTIWGATAQMLKNLLDLIL
jgi:8-oxo-dGTP pyrophosphatase MutT (NUDIX family)